MTIGDVLILGWSVCLSALWGITLTALWKIYHNPNTTAIEIGSHRYQNFSIDDDVYENEDVWVQDYISEPISNETENDHIPFEDEDDLEYSDYEEPPETQYLDDDLEANLNFNNGWDIHLPSDLLNEEVESVYRSSVPSSTVPSIPSGISSWEQQYQGLGTWDITRHHPTVQIWNTDWSYNTSWSDSTWNDNQEIFLPIPPQSDTFDVDPGNIDVGSDSSEASSETSRSGESSNDSEETSECGIRYRDVFQFSELVTDVKRRRLQYGEDSSDEYDDLEDNSFDDYSSEDEDDVEPHCWDDFVSRVDDIAQTWSNPSQNEISEFTKELTQPDKFNSHIADHFNNFADRLNQIPPPSFLSSSDHLESSEENSTTSPATPLTPSPPVTPTASSSSIDTAIRTLSDEVDVDLVIEKVFALGNQFKKAAVKSQVSPQAKQLVEGIFEATADTARQFLQSNDDSSDSAPENDEALDDFCRDAVMMSFVADNKD